MNIIKAMVMTDERGNVYKRHIDVKETGQITR